MYNRFTRGMENKYSLRKNMPLTNEEMITVAPSIFAPDAHESRSSKYTYIPTINILEGLRNEGFMPFMVAQSSSRIEGKTQYTKHMIRLRQYNEIAKEMAHEIILVNSHDGTSSYQVRAGMFRMVCANGLVSGDTIEDVKIRHSGNIKDSVIEAAYEIVDRFQYVDQDIDLMKSTILTLPEKAILGESALMLKYGEGKSPVSGDKITQIRRIEDKGNAAWDIFNTTQENMIRGGQRGRSATNTKTTTRPVKSVSKDLSLNKSLWYLTTEFCKLKNGTSNIDLSQAQ